MKIFFVSKENKQLALFDYNIFDLISTQTWQILKTFQVWSELVALIFGTETAIFFYLIQQKHST